MQVQFMNIMNIAADYCSKSEIGSSPKQYETQEGGISGTAVMFIIQTNSRDLRLGTKSMMG